MREGGLRKKGGVLDCVFLCVEWMMADSFCSVFVCQEAWCEQRTTTNLLWPNSGGERKAYC
jgi:hypothetical protein